MSYRAIIAKYAGEKNIYLKSAPEFYRTFPHDNQIDIDLPVKVLARNTFLDLMKDILSTQNRNILIVAHGSEKNGLYLDIGCKKKIITYMVMFRMLLYMKITRKFNESGTKTNPEKLVEVIKLIRDYSINDPDSTRDELLSLENPLSHPVYEEQRIKLDQFKRMPDTSSEEKAKKEKFRNEMIKAYLKYINQEIQNLEKIFKSKRTLLDYIKAIDDVHRLQISNIAIRGCNIGKSRSLLDIYRRFFNAQSINGPKVKIKYGKAMINLRKSQRILDITMKKAVVRMLGNKVDPVNWIGGQSTSLQGPKDQETISGLYYHPEGHQRNKDELLITVRSSSICIVAEHIEIAIEFAIDRFGPFAPGFRNSFRRNKKSRQFEMPVCWLEQYPLSFPRDISFGQSLELVSGPVR